MKAEQQQPADTRVTAEQPRPADTRIKNESRLRAPAAGGKPGDRRSTWIWVVGFLVVGGLLIWMFLQANARRFDSELWVKVGSGQILKASRNPETGGIELGLGEVLTNHRNTEQGRAARFQLAWFFLWEKGIKELGSQLGPQALGRIKDARESYKKLLEEVKNDPILAPEAMYCIALATEALAAEDPNPNLLKQALVQARSDYNALSDDEKYQKSPFVKAAKERLEALKAGLPFDELENFYSDLARVIERNRLAQEAAERFRQDKAEPAGKVKGDK
jgi:hypothetical protein